MKFFEDDSNDKRILVTLIITMVILMGYPYFLDKYFPHLTDKGKVVEKEGKTSAPSGDVLEKESAITAGPAGERGEAPGGAAATMGKATVTEPAAVEARGAEQRLVTVETPLYKAVFTSLGGAIKSFELKEYRGALEEDSGMINVVSGYGGVSPFETRLESHGTAKRLVFTPSRESMTLGAGESGKLVFTWSGEGGVRLKKTYTISADDYMIDGSVTIDNGTGETLSGAISTEMVASYPETDGYYHLGPLYFLGGEVERQEFDDDERAENVLSGTVTPTWLGLEDKYFINAFIPDNESVLGWTSAYEGPQRASISVRSTLDNPPGVTKTQNYRVYIGPKEYDRLLSYKVGLEGAIEFGFFSFLAKPFLVSLNFLERYIKNYGIAIIILTLIIKILFYPLTKHSLQSMKKMSQISPQMTALRQKYKDNKEKMNKELMELYKRHKVNPVSGCLPMLLQLPVFIALYEVFYVAIELRHAPFIFWIADLSAKDPYYITPVLMGISMFVQQKMTPSAMDPIQAKMMLAMPIVLTFLFLSFPSGLVLYWLTNNVLSIAQQYKIHKDSTALTPQPDDKGKKDKGGGKDKDKQK